MKGARGGGHLDALCDVTLTDALDGALDPGSASCTSSGLAAAAAWRGNTLLALRALQKAPARGDGAHPGAAVRMGRREGRPTVCVAAEAASSSCRARGAARPLSG
jgi:hypothetical protein